MCLLFLLAAAAAPLSSQLLLGVARAGDSDSLTVGDTSVRLFGIDAPEFNQVCTRGGEQWACGAEAADRLSRLVTGKELQCHGVGTDQHGRVLAQCFVGTTDVNRAMVASGYAVAFRRYSHDYVVAEETAKAAKLGLWSGTFEMPAEHRASTRPAAKAPRVREAVSRRAPAAGHKGGCTIKGNHSRKGEWSYHLPGMPYYEQTRPEDIFCSEAEARAAGYRRSRAR